MAIPKTVSVKHTVLQIAKVSLATRQKVLKSKVFITEKAMNALSAIAEKAKTNTLAQDTVTMEKTEKENTGMKSLLKGIIAVAAVGAVAGAAYAYYKKNKVSGQDYEELIFTDDMNGDISEVEYVEVEPNQNAVELEDAE